MRALLPRCLGVFGVLALAACGASTPAPGATSTVTTSTVTTSTVTTSTVTTSTVTTVPSASTGISSVATSSTSTPGPTVTSIAPAPTSITAGPTPPKITAAVEPVGPVFADATCAGEVIGGFALAGGGVAAVRAGPAGFCMADANAGIPIPAAPPEGTDIPYVVAGGDGWLGGFALIVMPAGFPDVKAVVDEAGNHYPFLWAPDRSALLVQTHDSADGMAGSNGTFRFLAADGTVLGATGDPTAAR